MVDLPKFLKLKAAAEMLSAAGSPVSVEYLRVRCVSGVIPAKKLGRGWKISEAALLEWLNTPTERREDRQINQDGGAQRAHGASRRNVANGVDTALLIESMSKTFRKGSLAERLYKASKKLPR
jgi:hypothetical protein